MNLRVDALSPLKRNIRLQANSMQIRLAPLGHREFERDVYRSGVISLSRLLWGSLGGGLLLTIVGFFSHVTGIGVLFPPLAATCFIVSACPYLRVARPKPIIVGHFIASICGLAGVWAGDALMANSEYATAAKLGLSVLFATVLMQLLDADHPPAAATSAIPAILPLPMAEYMLPFYMAWGATLTVLFSFIWNRVWFEFPVRDDDNNEKQFGLYMENSQIGGTALCMLGFVLMCFNIISPITHAAGIMCMLAGVVILGTHHFFELRHKT